MFRVPKDFKYIAKIGFRLDTDKVLHIRKVYTAVDLLCDVGGIFSVLTFIFMMFFGGYIEFNTKLEAVKNLYLI